MGTLVSKAEEYAINKHDLPSESQRYGNAPYSKHIKDVVGVGEKYINYIQVEMREFVRCALNLHDTVEDTDTSVGQLRKIFGNIVADIVSRVTNERGEDRKEKNFKTYPRIWQNDLAIYVKLSDRIANTKNSKNSTDEKGVRMYKIYRKEYPIFRYALKIKGLYPNMWKELDELNNYND